MKRLLSLMSPMLAGWMLVSIPALAQSRGHRPMTRGTAKVSATAPAPRAPRAAAPGRVSAQVARNPALGARLQPLLPAGVSVDTAAEGFRNLGQFVAAVHVSRNLGIPFEDLKARMTGARPASLGRAIQDLQPSRTPDQVKQDVETAEREGKSDIAASKSAPRP